MPERWNQDEVLSTAGALRVVCGGCAKPALPFRVRGIVARPQWSGTQPYAMVEFRCETPDCDTDILCEVDL
jgi:hypothetical protein